MTRHPKDPGPEAMAAASLTVLLGLLIILGVLSFLAQCHHATAPAQSPDYPYTLDTGRATCEPWPQCQDAEPPEKP